MYTSTRKGRRLSITTLIFAALLCLACAGSALAQSDNATVAGFVKDQAGAVVPNAKVTVKSDTRALERSAIANGEGCATTACLLPAGSKSLRARELVQYDARARHACEFNESS